MMKKLCITAMLSTLAAIVFVSDGVAQTRIRFARGRTSATVSGSIAGGGRRTYVLGARDGQYLSGNVSSRNGCVKFAEGSTSLGITTDAGDNILSITNYCARATSFTMTVSINSGSD
jgi:hypothetical protein